MRDNFDRVEHDDNGGTFLMGLLVGTALGAGLGFMFAPKSGAALRADLSKQAGDIKKTATEGYQQATETAAAWAEKGRTTAADWAETGKDTYGKAREAVKTVADEAQRYARDTAASVEQIR